MSRDKQMQFISFHENSLRLFIEHKCAFFDQYINVSLNVVLRNGKAISHFKFDVFIKH